MHLMHINGVVGTIVIQKVNDGPKFMGVHAPRMFAGVFLYPCGEAANDAPPVEQPPERA